MAWLLLLLLLGGVLVRPGLLQARSSEYSLQSDGPSPCELRRSAAVARQQANVPQCAEDGRFRPVQCGVGGQECWCVDAEGQEVAGTRTNSSAPLCASPCQLQAALRCAPSGLFEQVQCEPSRGQCWCVDQEGMELYGTRRSGRPRRCPGSCEVRGRSLLHSSAPHTPPQCDESGAFLPVQCVFLNTSTGAQLDLMGVFSSSPEAFQTFSGLRKLLPAVSPYCFCSDSRGREMPGTGVELPLTHLYDSAFPAGPPVRTFAQSNVYQVLRRRTLAVRLAVSGRFRCPSPCEEERRAASGAPGVYVPSCEPGGGFSARQCQRGAQCWCADAAGRELPGSRRRGAAPDCGGGPDSCPSQRRRARFRLLSAAAAPSRSPSSLGSGHASCAALVRTLEPLLPVGAELRPFLSQLVEAVGGLFRTVGGALRALSGSSHRRFQENLFGGNFLSQLASSNLSGLVGARGGSALTLTLAQQKLRPLNRLLGDQAFLRSLQGALAGRDGLLRPEQVLAPLLRSCSAPQLPAFLPSCTPGGAFRPIQCGAGRCWCVDPRGRELPGSRSAGPPARCPSACEQRRADALRRRAALAAGAELYVPACSQDGDFLPLQCVASRCFCVDANGNSVGPAGGAGSCPERTGPTSSSGRCSGAVAKVTALRQEMEPVLEHTSLRDSQSEEEPWARPALPLPAFPILHHRSLEPFVPQCDGEGDWLNTQCYHNTGQCWCVDEDGELLPDSLSSRSLHLPKCLTRCQRARARALLSGWKKASGDSSPSYSPRCEQDGTFSVLQTEGAAGWCVHPQTGEQTQEATLGPGGQLTCPSRCRLLALQCQPDASFLPLQCDATSCWCVSEDGQEVSGTRTLVQTGRQPSCDRPLCPAPTLPHGALVCQPAAGARQSCRLTCHHGYQNTLPFSSFVCHTESGQWAEEHTPVGGACQLSQPLQLLSSSQLWSLPSSCSHVTRLRPRLLHLMTSRGLCSAQLPVSARSVSLCDDASVHLQCDTQSTLLLTVSWRVGLPELPASDLPSLRDVRGFLNASSLLQGVQALLGELQATLTSRPQLLSLKAPSLACFPGYRLDLSGAGCLVCPAGTLSRGGACVPCPPGTYQGQEGRDFCSSCPRGSSHAGASSVRQCATECQRRGLRCSEEGDFLPAQPHALTGRWRCFSSEGAELDWTDSDSILSDEECSVFRRFQAVSGSDVIVSADDTEVLRTLTSDLSSCLHACAAEPACHHVALFDRHRQCELYSTHTVNTHCNTSQQTRGFLGNPQAERSDWLSCFPRVRGGASDLLVIKKKGLEFSSSWQQERTFVRMRMAKVLSGVYRTQAFSSRETSLSDLHRFCQDVCRRDTCCHGYVINQNSFESGSLWCGWLRSPSVLMCAEQDWDVAGGVPARRRCGAGLRRRQQDGSFLFDFGGQEFTIDASAAADHQDSAVSFQAVYLDPDADEGGAPGCSGTEDLRPPPDASVKQRFQVVAEADVTIDPNRKLPSLSFWLNKNHFDSQHALLWCLSRCEEEPHCSLADLRDADSARFHSCSLHPDIGGCGGYEDPLRRRCGLVLATPPNNTYSRTVNLSGPIKSFYERVSFQKMVAYSVRSRARVTGNTSLSEGFRWCERRCDEDLCCRGFGFIRDTKTPLEHRDVLCVSVISFGVQTCSEEDLSSWRTQDCSPSVQTRPEPLGWYQKPAHQWGPAAALCPESSLSQEADGASVSLDGWRLLSDSLVLVDPSVSTYEVIHVSRDGATGPERTRDRCLRACQGAESCVAVTLGQVESATRCVLYPDTRVCGSASCRLLVREPAQQVYLRTDWPPPVTSVSVPDHGTLRGAAAEAALGSDRKAVVRFLGVPYARPPVGPLRFEEAQPSDWMGSWDATQPRPSCVQPGDGAAAASSEDCLYLNIFSPAQRRGRVPVLVFFINVVANQSSALLDGSILAAVGNIVVVTASYRVAAFGFLSTGSSGLQGNYGLSDQKAVLGWVHAHISLVGGDSGRVTVGAEQRGADLASLHLLSSSPPFQRLLLMGGSAFSPSLLQTPPASRRLALQLASELGCVDDRDDIKMAACLRAIPAHQLNAAQTKLLAVSGPFQSWAPLRQPTNTSAFHRVDLLIGTSQHDGLIARSRRIKDQEALRGRADGKTAFYEALSRSLGGPTGSQQLKEAAVWFYSLAHSPSAAGYNLFSRALDNATRDLFITCPSLRMASHWARSDANAFLYHQPLSTSHSRAETSAPLDVQLLFGRPHHPINIQRFTSSDRRLSLATMTYFSTFVRTGNPNPSGLWAESVLPQWPRVTPSNAPPAYLELSPALQQGQGLSQRSCSFWNQLAGSLSSSSGMGAESVLQSAIPELPLAVPSSQSQTGKDGYS